MQITSAVVPAAGNGKMELQVGNGVSLAAVAIVNKKGETTGHRVKFGEGGTSFREMKERLKATNPKLSSREVTKMVNDVVRGRMTLQQQCGAAAHAMVIQMGGIPDVLEIRRNTAVQRYIFPREPKVKAPVKALALTAEEHADALGLNPLAYAAMKSVTPAELDEFKAYQAAKAAKSAPAAPAKK